MKLVRNGGLAAWWLVIALFMTSDWRRDPYDPTRVATAAYGHNYKGALTEGLVVTLVELLVLYAILRPWSYRRSWLRAAVALGVYMPWTGFSALMAMHAGGIYLIHLLWLLVLVSILFGCLLWSGVATIRQ